MPFVSEKEARKPRVQIEESTLFTWYEGASRQGSQMSGLLSSKQVWFVYELVTWAPVEVKLIFAVW